MIWACVILSLVTIAAVTTAFFGFYHMGRSHAFREAKASLRRGAGVTERAYGQTNVDSMECLTCRSRTAQAGPLQAHIVDDFLIRHNGHGVRVHTVSGDPMKGPWSNN